jgi:hypothetical protein
MGPDIDVKLLEFEAVQCIFALLPKLSSCVHPQKRSVTQHLHVSNAAHGDPIKCVCPMLKMVLTSALLLQQECMICCRVPGN